MTHNVNRTPPGVHNAWSTAIIQLKQNSKQVSPSAIITNSLAALQQVVGLLLYHCQLHLHALLCPLRGCVGLEFGWVSLGLHCFLRLSMHCILVRGDAWPLLLSPCNTCMHHSCNTCTVAHPSPPFACQGNHMKINSGVAKPSSQ